MLDHPSPTKDELRRIAGRVAFYCDENIEPAIVEVLRHLKYDVETADEAGARGQPDEFHFRRAFKRKRVLVTLDRDYLDPDRFPLSQTRGVIILNIDTANEGQIARALEVVTTIFGDLAPVLNEAKAIVNSDYSLTLIRRQQDKGRLVDAQARYRLDENGRDVWTWED